MATKDDRPGLLSKMAMFVRNPTKDWSELERPQVDQDSGYDKQVLKQMIERKRQNDFIRKREFDQLRKLRSRGVSAVAGMGRPSVFQSSMATDPDGRAVTLKKIDEIEAQMSKQWWKGKQDAASAPGVGLAAAQTPPREDAEPSAPAMAGGEPTVPAPIGLRNQFGAAEPSELPSGVPTSDGADFLATEMGDGMEPPPVPAKAKARAASQSSPMMGVLVQSYDGAEVGFSTSKLFAIDVEDMATDPELEEAAIRFANGDDSGAESGLLEALRAGAVSHEVASSWAAALLDLYRATRDRARFDQAVTEFAYCFETMVPQWCAIGDEPEPLIATPASDAGFGRGGDARDYSVGAIWRSPPELNAQAMEELREAMASNPTPWHLDWSRLVRIDEDAMPLMAGLFSSLCNEPVPLRFSGAARLVETLRTMMPSGDQSVSPDWWAMRLNALRTLQLLDDFELAALDYCVTYEVSPPAWQEARCQYENVEDQQQDAAAQTNQVRVEAASGWGSGFSQMATAPIGLDGSTAITLELKGDVLGDATQALEGLDAAKHAGEGIVVSCRGLVRVDFSAAGSILNWVALRQAEGCHIQFRDVHRLVAAFFNVIGINEHARVVPRPI
ncbi:MAG: STAS domain-containing protein [Burkholderiales bacterium]|nr:STAS domain-containing protein [Burkholderiales bacterium]